MYYQPGTLRGKPRLPPRLQNARDTRDTIPEDGDQRRDNAPRNGKSSEKQPLEKKAPIVATARSNTRRPDSTPIPPLSNRFSAIPQTYAYYDPNSAHPNSTLHPDDFRKTTQLSRRESAPAGNGFRSYPADGRIPRMIDPPNRARMVNSTIYTPPMNPQSASHPSSQQYLSDPQGAEYWVNAGPSAMDSTQFVNDWGSGGEQTPQGCYNGAVPLPRGMGQTPLEYHNSVIPQPGGGEQTSQAYFNSAIPQRRATTGNNNFYREPLAGPQQATPYNDRRHTESEIPRMPQEDSQESQHVNTTFSSVIPQPGSVLARTQSDPSTTNRSTSDRQHSIHNYQPMQYPPEYYQHFDLQTGMIALGIHESDGKTYYVAGNETWRDGNDRDGQSVASRTTNNSESTDSIDITYSSPASEDDGPSSRRMSSEPANGVNDLVSPSGIDQGRSQQRFEEQDGPDTDAFECEVDVWPNDTNGRRVKSVTLKFDTQCKGSNWVAAWIVDQLGVKPFPLRRSAQFIGFNGQSMTASHKITLWFETSRGGSSRRAELAEFLVSPVEDVPYELLLGAADCLRLKFVLLPTVLGLAARKLDPNEKEEEALREVRHAIKAQERSRLIQKERAIQRQQEQASRTSGVPQSNRRRDDDHHNNMRARQLKEDGVL